MTRTNERPVVVGCDRGMLRFSVARQVGFAPTRWSGITELTIIIAASLILASAHASPTQLAIPTEEQQQTTQQFDSFATCIAYWRVVGQCLPPGMTQKDQALLRQSLDRLQYAAEQHLRELRQSARLSAVSQQAIVDRRTGQIFTSIGSSCRNMESAVRNYRDKCAALFKGVAEWKKE
jgi:hypothetical protein